MLSIRVDEYRKQVNQNEWKICAIESDQDFRSYTKMV